MRWIITNHRYGGMGINREVVGMIEELEKKIEKGEFRFGETKRLKRMKKSLALRRAREILVRAGLSDTAKLYGYVIALEKLVEALEEELEHLRNR